MNDIVTSLHGREIGLDARGWLVVRNGIVGVGSGVPGARADGVADDAPELNAAIAAVASIGGGSIKLKEGATYRINSRLDMASNVRLVGEDTAIEHNGQPFRANALTSGGFEGLTFRQIGVSGQGLIQNCTGFAIDRCNFENQVASVAITGTSNKVRIAFCEFTNGTSTALELNGTSVTQNDILFNTFLNNVGFGIFVTGGANKNLIEGNRTLDNGIELIGVTYESPMNRIIGNHAESCGDNGISISSQFNVLAGNVTNGNAFHGLALYGSRNVVAGHQAKNNGTAGAGYAGIVFAAGFGGCAQLNSVTGGYLDDDQSAPTQAHCVKFNAGGYTAWASSQTISGAGIYRRNANKLYRSTGAGTTGVTAPTHTSGTVSDGAVSWLYIDTFFSTSDEAGGNELSAIVMQRFLTSQLQDNTTQKTNKIDGYYRSGASPEGVIPAPVGALAINTAGSTSTTLYVKTSGTGNSGWTAK